MNQAFNIAMVLRADVASAKAALKDVTTGLREVSTEAGRTKSATAQEAAELERLAAAAVKASRSADEHAAAEKRRQTAQVLAIHGPAAQIVLPADAPNFLAGMPQAQTAAMSLQEAVRGLTASIGAQAHAAVEAAQSARAWQSALDDIRASFNPLFAVSRQYEQTLERIAEAEQLGAISAREAAAARERAAAQLGPQGRAGTGNAWITGNLAAQGNDIIMMAAAGQNPLQLALQQGTQVAQVFNNLEKGTSITRALADGLMSMVNPISLATIGIIGLGTFGVQALMKLVPPSKSAAEAFDALEASVSGYADAVKNLRSDSLAAEFGTATIAAQGLLAEVAELKRQLATTDMADWLSAIGPEIMGGDLGGIRSRSDQFAALQRMFGEASWYNSGRISEEASPHSYAVMSAANDARRVAKAGGSLDEQIAAAEKLRSALRAAADVSGSRSKEERKWLLQLDEGIVKLRQMRALQENAAGKAAAEGMARELERQAEMQAKIAAFGKDSNEVRALELLQQKQVAVEKLKSQQIDRTSAEGRRVMAAVVALFDGQQAAAARARRDAQIEYLTGQDAQIAQIEREIGLLGASAGERAKSKALSEAELEISRRKLSVAEAQEVREKAIARAAAETRLEREKALRARQLAATTDALDAQIGLARDPLTRATLEGQREYARVLSETNDAEHAAGEAARVRARAMTEATNGARMQAAELLDELAARQQVAAQVAAGTLLAGDANAVIQRELQLRPLIAAAARAEGEEKRRLTEIVDGLRLAHALQAAEERRQAQNDYLRGAAERVQQARLELALIGQTATVRARVLALVQAERDIRAQGLTGDYAAETRRQALEMADLNRQIEAQGDAWASVQSAGEGAIDAVLDKLRGGDVKGAFAGLLDELNEGFFDLAIRNPLKNAIFGTNLGTLDDIGGLRGIRDRLTGRAPLDERAVIGAATAPVQAMQIAAAQVTINAASLGLGGGAAGLLAGLPGAVGSSGAANANVAPLKDPNGIARRIFDFFTGKGFAPHQAAALVGAANTESGFDPFAVGDNGNAIGLFQHNGPRMRSLLSAIGGRGNLGNIEAQLEHVMREFMGPESAAYRRLMAAPDLRSAAWAVQGFERPSGYDAGRIGSGMHWDKRLAGAEQALATFGNAAQAAAAPVGQMGQSAQAAAGQVGEMGAGMGEFGGALQQILGAAVGGNKGGALGGLLNLGIGMLTKGMSGVIPGFSSGGATGGSDPSRVAGVVHEQEYVFSAAAVRRIGARNLDALHRGTLRGFASGGYVGPGPLAAAERSAGASSAANITFAPSFDLRGANDPDEVERAARRGMAQAIREYDDRLPQRLRALQSDPRQL